MKRIYFNTLTDKCTAWWLLVVLCVGITGCNKESLPIVAKGEPTYISLSTKALNSGVAGSQINTVRVILINPVANHMIELNEFVDSPADPLIIPVKTGTYDVYVVANEAAYGIEDAALSNVYNLSSLRAVSLEYIANSRNLTNVPMIGEVKNVTITAPASGVPPSGNLASVSIGGTSHGTSLPVELERMVSKLSVKIISKHKSLYSADIRMPTYISLFEGALPPFRVNQVADIYMNSFTLTESTVDQAKHILECKDIIIPSQIFPSGTNSSDAMQFHFSINIGDDNLIALGHSVLGATKDYTIKRNHNYEMTITIIEKMIFTKITLKPWTPVDDNVEVL